ncbi:hypothetical protein [Yersinia thracica]|uniref:hypothetical protein n=1 Tax=Yersinia thracica TaxID=2890319 RepID=UPI00157D6934|nr:hypothetical protein [Yersinia thracica]
MSRKEEKPKSFSIKNEGEASFERNADGSLIVSSDKPIGVDIKNLLSVGIENIIDVEKYEINTLCGVTSHYVKFRNKGEVKFSYNESGKIVTFEVIELRASISNGDRLLIHSN